MNAPIKPQTSQKNTSYCKFGSEIVLKLLPVFEDQFEGVIKSEDTEYVHKMRVTSRRLRAALPLFRFCFPGREFKEWTRQLKKATRLLADARDLDVQIAFIQQYIGKLKPTAEKSGVNVLLEDHRERRRSIQSSVVSGLEKLEASNVLADIRNFCEKTIAEQSDATFDSKQVLEKARWHISFRIDDFLSMEKYVYLENKKLKHHEMRIYAKKLRYTIEAFAPLYRNKLAKEIETITAFQDVLGEMHDYDVWSDYIPKFIAKAKTKIKSKEDRAKFGKTLFKFLAYIKEQRRRHYNRFVRLWNRNENNNFFVKLRKKINAGFSMTKAKTRKLSANPDVKIAVLSDVHGNLQALEKVVEDAEGRGAEVFLNAGDSIGFGPYPNEVIEMLCEKNVQSVVGNYDLEVIEGKVKVKGEKKLALEFARKELAQSCGSYLQSLPRTLRLEVAGKKLFVTHGSPRSIEEHIYHDSPVEQLKAVAKAAKADVIIVGHSHEQFLRQEGEVYFVNPGSVGRPGDGNPQTAYAVLSFNPFNVELIRLDYDVKATADVLRRKALPESFSQMFLRGVSLDTILEKDENAKDAMVKNCIEMAEASRQIARTYLEDAKHFTRVTRLALKLFDGLISLHQLDVRERCWLECAAILHDVGLSKGRGGHHKETVKIILNDSRLPFTSSEKRIVASIARYHRKGLPKQKHYNFATLDRATFHKVEVLASVLRVADGLDYAHQSTVKSLKVKVATKKVFVECTSGTEGFLEEQAFNMKKDLFEKVFARKMVLVWKQQ